MRITSKEGVSIRKQLENVLTASLPMVRNTGLLNHLRAVECPKHLKGKAINFSYQKRDFKLTENLAVSEYTFGVYNHRAMAQNELSGMIQSTIRQTFANKNS